MSAKPRIPKNRPGSKDPKRALIKEKDVHFEGKVCRTRIYERSLLRAGNQLAGPALIFEYSATAAIPPAYSCVVDAYRNLLISDIRHQTLDIRPS